ncbi:MAG: LysM peptidoglycan-binding domain-containing protein [Flavobacterium sp.]|nr:LysM peptidoglycan-binding domain-containing protein [Candidatus Neoflavobacterium equi]
MKKIVILAAAIILYTGVTYGQSKYIEHKISKGETVTSISKKYNVTPSDIYKLNPNAVDGIDLDAVLKIPNSNAGIVKFANTPSASKIVKKHTVKAKETLFSIAKMYDVKVGDLEALNKKDIGVGGIKIGQVLLIPSAATTVTKLVEVPSTKTAPVAKPVAEAVKTTQEVAKNIQAYHTVSPKETKFGIAKQYQITVATLEQLNPEIKDNLEVGTTLRLNSNTPVYSPGAKTALAPAKNGAFVDYTVKPKETLYSLSKASGLTEEKFVALNPALKDGVQVGMVVKMPATSNNYVISVKKAQVDLSDKLNKRESKELVMLLPFNADKVGVNPEVTIQQSLKTDKFLNMTLDFYAGAMMAIDSAKKMGLPLKVKILDSKESNTSSAVSSLVLNNNLTSSDAVIGPFFQTHVETVAGLLEANGIPVISPLSNEKGKPFSNLYQAMPSNEDVKKKMMDFMFSKNANVIAVVDSKKGSVKKYLSETYPEVKIATLNDNGMPTAESLKAMLEPGKLNYVILETERTSMVLSTCSILTNNLSKFDIQLVTLEKNETLDSAEIPLESLTKLKLLYPSVTKENESSSASVFAKDFKKLNNIYPNKYATRGFDVTFDTILRLFNEGGYKTSVEEFASEQLENKFNYVNIDGAYYNKGVYLMYFDTDLTVKEAK